MGSTRALFYRTPESIRSAPIAPIKEGRLPRYTSAPAQGGPGSEPGRNSNQDATRMLKDERVCVGGITNVKIITISS